MAHDLYTPQELGDMFPGLASPKGQKVFSKLEKISGLDKLGSIYRDCSDFTGPDMAHELVKSYGIDYELGGLPLSELPEGPFITISNHPYGGADGLALIDFLGHTRPDMKVMVNKILGLAKGVSENLITVTPTGEIREAASPESIRGIKQSIEQIRNGGVLCLFPSGAVSDYNLKEMRVRDREWQIPAIKLIKKLNVPVVPIRFFDRNSAFFYFLGLLDWKIRLLRLPHEVMNKGGKHVRIGIGEPIPASKIREFSNLEDLSAFLRSSVYDMPRPKSYIKRDDLVYPTHNE